jgi:hypothetical protein
MRCRFTLRTTSPPDKLQHPLAIHQHDITSDGAFPVALSGSTTARGTDLCQPALDLSLASLKLLFQTWGEGLARWGDRYCNNGPANEKAVQLPPIPCDGPFIWIDQGPSEWTPVLLFSSAGTALHSDPPMTVIHINYSISLRRPHEMSFYAPYYIST